MKEEKKVIGRGLADLLSEHKLDEALEGEVILEVNVSEISPNPFQPRRHFDQQKLEELAASIKEHGVFQPIILKERKDGYVIVAGERRFRATKLVGLSTIPAIIRSYEEAKVAEIALIENLQREDLTPIEEAEAYLNVMTFLRLNQQQLANRIGKSRSHVTNMLGLLTLPDDVQNLVLEQKLSMGHARSISKLKDEKTIKKVASKIVTENLTVRDVENYLRELKRPTFKNETLQDFQKIEQEIFEKHNLKVKITKEKLTIHLGNEEDPLEMIKRIFPDEL